MPKKLFVLPCNNIVISISTLSEIFLKCEAKILTDNFNKSLLSQVLLSSDILFSSTPLNKMEQEGTIKLQTPLIGNGDSFEGRIKPKNKMKEKLQKLYKLN